VGELYERLLAARGVELPPREPAPAAA